jgi:hypothetical protein
VSPLRRLLLAAVTVAAFAAAAGSATAASLSIAPGGAITATSVGKITMETNIFGTGPECRFVLIGSLNRGPTAKVSGATLGSISSGNVTECSGGTGRLRFSSPTTWSLTYNGITGTLPEAVAALLVHIDGFQLLIEVPGGFNCEWRATLGTSLALVRIAGAEYRTANLELLEEDQRITSVTRLAGSFFNCPTGPTFFGSFTLTTQTITRT